MPNLIGISKEELEQDGTLSRDESERHEQQPISAPKMLAKPQEGLEIVRNKVQREQDKKESSVTATTIPDPWEKRLAEWRRAEDRDAVQSGYEEAPTRTHSECTPMEQLERTTGVHPMMQPQRWARLELFTPIERLRSALGADPTWQWQQWVRIVRGLLGKKPRTRRQQNKNKNKNGSMVRRSEEKVSKNTVSQSS